MRPLVLASILLASVLACGQDHPNTQTSQNAAPQASHNGANNPSLGVQSGTIHATEKSESTKQDANQKPAPWLSHGEWVMSILTGIYVLLTGIYVWLTGRSLKRISEGNEISRKNLEHVQRAFVFMEETKILTRQGSGNQIREWRFRFTWKNSGTTPTRELFMYGGYVLQPNELTTGYPFPSEGILIPLVLGPQTIMWSNEIPVSSETINRVRAGQVHLYIYGSVRYRDIFEKTPEHITKVFLKVGVDEDVLTQAASITLSSHFEHNCAN